MVNVGLKCFEAKPDNYTIPEPVLTIKYANPAEFIHPALQGVRIIIFLLASQSGYVGILLGFSYSDYEWGEKEYNSIGRYFF